MFERLTTQLKKPLCTEVPSSLVRGTLGSRQPSCVSIEGVSFLNGDMVGSPRQTRYYSGTRPLARTNSHCIPTSKKAATTYFNRESKLPHWVDRDRVRRALQLWRKTIHPRRWRAHQEDQEDLRTRDRTEGRTNNHDDPNKAFSHVPIPVSYENTPNYLTIDQTFAEEQARAEGLASNRPGPSAKSNPPGKTKLPPRFGRLQKGDEANERDFITTVGSFVSRVTRQVMDRIKGRSSDSEWRPIRGKLRKRRDSNRFLIEMDDTDWTKSPMTEPSTTLHSPDKIPPPGPLADSLRSRSPSKEHPQRNRLKKRFDDTNISPASSLRSISPNSLKKESDPSHSGHHSIGSYISSFDPLCPPSLSPSLASPPTPPSKLPSAQVHSQRFTPLDVQLPDPIDCSVFGDVESVAGSFTSDGTTLLGSVSSAHGHKSSAEGIKRQGTITSKISGTTAASAYSGRMSSSHSGITDKKSSGEKEPSHFILTTPTQDSRVPQKLPPDYRAASFWYQDEKGLEKLLLHNAIASSQVPESYRVAPSSLDHSAWMGQQVR